MTRYLSSFLSIAAVLAYIGVMSLWLSSQELRRYDARARSVERTSEREDEIGALSESREASDKSEHWSEAWETNSYKWARSTGEEAERESERDKP